MTIFQRWLLVGIAFALFITTIVTSLEVIENPGGIFQTEFGIQWQFVADTGLSWFVPLMLVAVPFCSVIGFVHQKMKQIKSKRNEA